MNLRRALSILIVADVFCAFATMGAEMFFRWSLPEALQGFTRSSPLDAVGLFGSVRLVLWVVSIACTLVAWVALPNLWWFGRRLYAIAWTTWILFLLSGGATVRTGPGTMFDTLNAAVGGAILGLVYFSDLRFHFERRKNVSPLGATAGA